MLFTAIKNQSRGFRERLTSGAWSARSKSHFLEVLAIFKNEAHVLEEWIQHYLRQGCDCINLIDNNSTDDYLSVLQSYIDRGQCRVTHESGRYAQYASYNSMLPALRRKTSWLIVCDLDEFMYARNGFRTIRDYLKSLAWDASCVQVLSKAFGSSGFKEQPRGRLLESFTWRCDYTSPDESCYAVENSRIDCKYIARLSRTRNLCCHRAELFWGKNQMPDGTVVESEVKHAISEDILLDHPVHLNHYHLQSEEFFRAVKMSRGDAMSPTGEGKRTMEFFTKFDANEILDDELALISKASMRQ